MRTKVVICIVAILCAHQGLCFAERQLNNEEIQQVLQSLTNQPRERWIPAGTIEARHDVFNVETGYITSSTTTVRYDGNRFYWAIDIDSHTQETIPKKKRRDHLRDAIDLNRNTKRIFAWNGEQYTMYFRSGKNAIIEEVGATPVTVNGPLTAGIIPWGYGIYTYNNLLTKELSATEVDSNGSKQIHLTVTGSNLPEMAFVLDPMKDHSVLSYVMNFDGKSRINKTYGNYEKVSGRWIPKAIMIERYDLSSQSPEILSYDNWDITNVNTQSPPPDSFEVGYGIGTLVEYNNPTFSRPLVYRHTDRIDTAELLNEKIMIELTANKQHQNCAAKAVKYVMRKFDIDVGDPNLVALSNGPDRHTSLYKLRQFVRQYGLHSIAVKTGLETLETLADSHVILHLPGTKHYVVFGYVDGKSVWVIDLDSNKFLYPISIQDFLLEWSDGTALIISDNPLTLPENMTEINDSRLSELFGASGGFGNYSCTDLIQEYDVVLCSEPVSGLCGGEYRIYYNRYACELSTSSGSCGGTCMVSNISSSCTEDIYDPTSCVVTGEWSSWYIRACI